MSGIHRNCLKVADNRRIDAELLICGRGDPIEEAAIIFTDRFSGLGKKTLYQLSTLILKLRLSEC